MPVRFCNFWSDEYRLCLTKFVWKTADWPVIFRTPETVYVFRQRKPSDRIDAQGLSSDPFGVDDLMPVKQQLKIVDKTAVLRLN